MNTQTNTTHVKCHRCNGQGTIAELLHVQNGVCFTCGGTGRLSTGHAEAQTELEQHCDLITSWLEGVVENNDINEQQLMYIYLPKKLGDRVISLVAHADRVELRFMTELGQPAVIRMFNESKNIVCLTK